MYIYTYTHIILYVYIMEIIFNRFINTDYVDVWEKCIFILTGHEQNNHRNYSTSKTLG